MTSALALILLAQAAAPCPASGAVQLGGGAILVRPVGIDEAPPLVPLGPAPALISQEGEIHQTGAAREPRQKGADPALAQCRPVPIPIV